MRLLNRSGPPSSRPSSHDEAAGRAPAEMPCRGARVMVARQPIVDAGLRLHGYELLFRGARGETADPERWTASLIVDGLAELGLRDLVGDALAYINVSRGFLLEVDPLPFEPGGVVLELTEDSHHTDEALLARLRDLRKHGYRIALDDFSYDPALAPLVELADVIKLDVLADGLERTAEVVAHLSAFGVELLAEKVETQSEFEACRRLGFKTFQGYFFARPREFSTTCVSAQALAGLDTVAALNDPALSFEDLEGIVSSDVGLSYKILRYANSGFFSLNRRVETVHEALVFLGEANVRQWATVMSLAGSTSRPPALISLALLRARLCQRVAASRGGVSEHVAFTVGLFSVVDALLDVPMDQALERLPFSPEVKSALLGDEGPIGSILGEVVGVEGGSLQVLAGIGGAVAYAEASTWADGVTGVAA